MSTYRPAPFATDDMSDTVLLAHDIAERILTDFAGPASFCRLSSYDIAPPVRRVYERVFATLRANYPSFVLESVFEALDAERTRAAASASRVTVDVLTFS